MNDFYALMKILMAHYSEGEPLIDARDRAASGPCPRCLHRIEPSPEGFPAHLAPALPGSRKIAGIIVCGGCGTALLWRTPGKYETIPRDIARRLPKATRTYIAKTQELLAVLRKKIN